MFVCLKCFSYMRIFKLYIVLHSLTTGAENNINSVVFLKIEESCYAILLEVVQQRVNGFGLEYFAPSFYHLADALGQDAQH